MEGTISLYSSREHWYRSHLSDQAGASIVLLLTHLSIRFLESGFNPGPKQSTTSLPNCSCSVFGLAHKWYLEKRECELSNPPHVQGSKQRRWEPRLSAISCMIQRYLFHINACSAPQIGVYWYDCWSSENNNWWDSSVLLFQFHATSADRGRVWRASEPVPYHMPATYQNWCCTSRRR